MLIFQHKKINIRIFGNKCQFLLKKWNIIQIFILSIQFYFIMNLKTYKNNLEINLHLLLQYFYVSFYTYIWMMKMFILLKILKIQIDIWDYIKYKI